MADSKYVVFNCSRGPITITLYRQSDLVELAKHASYKRRRMAKEVFTTVVVPSNSSKDLVAETGISIEELEKNKELQHLIALNKFRVMVNTDKPVIRTELKLRNKAALQIKPVEKKVEEVVVEEVVESLPKEEKHVQVVVSDFVEEVVDPEELRNILIKESDAVDRGDDEEVAEGVVQDLPKEEKPKTEKKRGRKPKKTRK